MPLARVFLLALCLPAGAAFGHTALFAEDFEAPLADWGQGIPPAGDQLTGAEVHRGTGAAIVSEPGVYLRLPVPNVGVSLYARVWLKPKHSRGAAKFLTVYSGLVGVVASIGVTDQRSWAIEGSGVPPVELARMEERWYLVELWLELGAARVLAWIDGVNVAAVPVTVSLASALELKLGAFEPQDFEGDIYLDDFTLSTFPPATRLRLHGPAGDLKVGDCVPLVLYHHDSAGNSTADGVAGKVHPYYEYTAKLTSEGASSRFYTDPGCTQPTESLFIPDSFDDPIVYLGLEEPGRHLVSARYEDLLEDETALDVSADVLPVVLDLSLQASESAPLGSILPVRVAMESSTAVALFVTAPHLSLEGFDGVGASPTTDGGYELEHVGKPAQVFSLRLRATRPAEDSLVVVARSADGQVVRESVRVRVFEARFPLGCGAGGLGLGALGVLWVALLARLSRSAPTR